MTTVTLNEETIKDITRRLEKIDLICERQANIHFNAACKCEVFDDLVNDESAIGMAKVFALIKHAVIECLGDLEEEDT
jgi:hypothetical protein|tara:strand:- start:2017 stop:2250 length:234 start_codon:yes stop_codon:yes gene_type:complete